MSGSFSNREVQVLLSPVMEGSQDVQDGSMPRPRLIVTLKGNPASEAVICELQKKHGSAPDEVVVKVLEGDGALADLLAGGLSRQEVVVLFDNDRIDGHFEPTLSSRRDARFPWWSCGAFWGVKVSRACLKGMSAARCARQLSAYFVTQFEERTKHGRMPWGVTLQQAVSGRPKRSRGRIPLRPMHMGGYIG